MKFVLFSSGINTFKAFKILFFILVGLVISAFLYLPNYARICELRRANAQVEKKLKQLKIEIKDLKEKMRKVNKDSHFYEQIARDDFGVARQGEIVVDIKE